MCLCFPGSDVILSSLPFSIYICACLKPIANRIQLQLSILISTTFDKEETLMLTVRMNDVSDKVILYSAITSNTCFPFSNLLFLLFEYNLQDLRWSRFSNELSLWWQWFWDFVSSHSAMKTKRLLKLEPCHRSKTLFRGRISPTHCQFSLVRYPCHVTYHASWPSYSRDLNCERIPAI